MFSILHHFEEQMPNYLKNEWQHCHRNGIYIQDNKYVYEIYKINQTINFQYTDVIIKIIAGACTLSLNDHSCLACENGFEYINSNILTNFCITPNEDDVLILIIHSTEVKNNACLNASLILDDLRLYYTNQPPTQVVANNTQTKWRISHDLIEKNVLIDFEHPVNWMNLEPHEAEDAAKKLLHHARKARGF